LSNGSLHLFIQELKVCGTLVFDILGLVILILPISTTFPLVVVFILKVVAEVKILLFGGFFTV
jgi:hypothetical protein